MELTHVRASVSTWKLRDMLQLLLPGMLTLRTNVQVPMDQGKHALAMLEHLTRDKKFGDEVLHAEERGVGADTHMASRVVGLRGGITVE